MNRGWIKDNLDVSNAWLDGATIQSKPRHSLNKPGWTESRNPDFAPTYIYGELNQNL